MPVASLCLILDSVLLAFGEYSVNPEAAMIAGAAHRLQAELAAAPQDIALTLAAIEDADSGAALAALGRIAGDPVAGVALAAGAPVGPDACPAPHAATILVTREGGRPVTGGAVAWPLGDAAAGLGAAHDADRRLRERLGWPVPRTVGPDMRHGGLVMLPPETDIDVLLRAVYASDSVSWVRIGARAFLYTEDTDQEDALAALPGARTLSHRVNLGRLAFVSATAPPPTAEALYVTGGLRLIERPPDLAEGGGMAWGQLEFGTLR